MNNNKHIIQSIIDASYKKKLLHKYHVEGGKKKVGDMPSYTL